MTEYETMTDEEFDEVLEELFKLAMNGGDLGYQYWSRVMKKLKFMRSQALKFESKNVT